MPKRLGLRLTAVLAVPLAIGLPALAQEPYNVAAPGDWPRYARDLEGTRFSPLDQIDTGNVKDLEQAWSFRLRPEGGAGLLGGTVPIAVDGILYLPLGNAVVAIDGATGNLVCPLVIVVIRCPIRIDSGKSTSNLSCSAGL